MTVKDLDREQLLIYASELGRHFRTEHGLRQELSLREEQNQDLMAASLVAQEEERQKLAFEVHDRIAQNLASVFQQLQTLESVSRADPTTRRVAVRASVLLREAIREARDIMNDLHPPLLDEFGVLPLIEEDLRRLQEEKGYLTQLKNDYMVRPPRDVEVAIYRIAHEALVNIRRHAVGASHVTVSLASCSHGANLEVGDDGLGFDVEKAARNERVGGLMSMRRRAELLQGTMLMKSEPGKGTLVLVWIPWPRRRLEDRRSEKTDSILKVHP